MAAEVDIIQGAKDAQLAPAKRSSRRAILLYAACLLLIFAFLATFWGPMPSLALSCITVLAACFLLFSNAAVPSLSSSNRATSSSSTNVTLEKNRAALEHFIARTNREIWIMMVLFGGASLGMLGLSGFYGWQFFNGLREFAPLPPVEQGAYIALPLIALAIGRRAIKGRKIADDAVASARRVLSSNRPYFAISPSGVTIGEIGPREISWIDIARFDRYRGRGIIRGFGSCPIYVLRLKHSTRSVNWVHPEIQQWWEMQSKDELSLAFSLVTQTPESELEDAFDRFLPDRLAPLKETRRLPRRFRRYVFLHGL